MTLGISLGVIGAFLQSVSYVLSKNSLIKTKMSAMRFLMLSHSIIGVFAACIYFFYLEINLPKETFWIIYSITGSICYMLGQFCLIEGIQCSAASRVALLLSVKVPILMTLSFAYSDGLYNHFHFIAV